MVMKRPLRGRWAGPVSVSWRQFYNNQLVFLLSFGDLRYVLHCLQAVVSPCRAPRYEGRDITASNRLLL